MNFYSIKIIKIWKSDFKQILKKQDINIIKINDKYNSKNFLINFYNEKNDLIIWNFHNSLKNDINQNDNENNNENNDNDQKKFFEIQ